MLEDPSTMSATTASTTAVATVKKTLRRQIAATLRATEDAEIARQSAAIAARVAALPEFQRAQALSVYLHMPKEAATTTLLHEAFNAGKKVYVPKITGRSAEDLRMLAALGLEDIAAFPKDNWGIPDPHTSMGDGSPRADAMETLDLDLVLMPGVAFDRRGGRLGHGKGYYDSFLRRLEERHAARDASNPTKGPTRVGICLTSQLVDAVPLSAHDKLLDVIVTPDEVIRIKGSPLLDH